eukprot:2058816-Rhodomonas_salina.1
MGGFRLCCVTQEGDQARSGFFLCVGCLLKLIAGKTHAAPSDAKIYDTIDTSGCMRATIDIGTNDERSALLLLLLLSLSTGSRHFGVDISGSVTSVVWVLAGQGVIFALADSCPSEALPRLSPLLYALNA